VVLAASLLYGCSHLDNGLTKADYRDLTARQPPPGATGGPAGGPAAEPPIPEMQPILAAPPPPALEQRLVTVNVPDPDVPVRDVLIELARKVGVDLDLDPKISGGIILYAKDRPFAEVIDRICDMANLRYSFKDNVLRIEVDTMIHRDYRLEILNSVRKATMAVATSTDVFSAVQGGGSGAGNNSSSSVTSDSTNDPWKDINDNLTQILTNSNPATQPVQSNVVGSNPEGAPVSASPAPVPKPTAANGGIPVPNPTAPPPPVGANGGAPSVIGAEGTSNQATVGNPGASTSGAGGTGTGGTTGAAGGAPSSNPLAAAQQAILNQALGGTDTTGGGGGGGGGGNGNGAAGAGAAAANSNIARFSINKSAGIVSVFGTMKQQKLVQDYLSKIVAEATAQVLIEAKVIEVDLNDQFKTGIDWQKALNLNHGSNSISIGTAPGGVGFINDQSNFAKQTLSAATQNPFSIGFTGHDFTSLLQFVEGFGTTRTLSSPRITVLNNQTAVLKVAQNQVYFSLTATITPSTVAGVANTATYSSTLHTVPIGVVMTVQPAIDIDKDQVTMSLRPTVSVHNGDVSDPAVALSLASACNGSSSGPCSSASISTAVTNSNVPVVEVREMDSVVTLPSGDIVIMGGLMQSNVQKQETGIPGAADVPLLGNLFKAQSDETDVTELVIFLKASIVHGNDSVDWADKDLYKRYIQDPRPLAF